MPTNTNTAERKQLWNELIVANADRKALSRRRGPLGHGVVYIEPDVLAARYADLDARIANLRAGLAASK